MHGAGRVHFVLTNFNYGPFHEELDQLETEPTALILLRLSLAVKFHSFRTSKGALSGKSQSK